ncbi:MAG: hypothetical protein HY727_21285 [Candidatus Rokubacteria bacterium]|nr:hypothetical protein [Candidatus Rokubacteria bacterium]
MTTRRALPLLLLLLVGAASVTPVAAVEYRLQVASLHQDTFTHYLEGKIGSGVGELVLARLAAAMDAGQVAKGGLLYDRPLQGVPGTVAEGFRAVKIRAEVVRGGEGSRLWDEVVWDGTPGERSVWLIGATTPHFPEVRHVGLKAASPLRYYIPYSVPLRPTPQRVVAFPLNFVQWQGERGTLWDKYLGRAVSPDEGIAVVIGVNDNMRFADWVYFIIEQPREPQTFKAVLGWERRRSLTDEAPRLKQDQ